jgi:hypothetical protein
VWAVGGLYGRRASCWVMGLLSVCCSVWLYVAQDAKATAATTAASAGGGGADDAQSSQDLTIFVRLTGLQGDERYD